MKNKSLFCQAMFAKSSHSLIKLRMTHGPAGLGIYMCVLEALFDEPDAVLPRDCDTIAFRFNLDAELVRSVIEDFDLFEFSDDGLSFYCKLLCESRRPKSKRAPKKSDVDADPIVPDETAAVEVSPQSEIVVLPLNYQDPTMKPLPPLTYDQKVALDIERFSQMTPQAQIDLLRQDPEWLKYCAMDFHFSVDSLLNHLDQYQKHCIVDHEMHYNIFDLKYRFTLWLGNVMRSVESE